MSAWRLITLLAGTAIVLVCAIAVAQRAWRRGRGTSTSVSAATLRRLRGEDDE